MPGTVMSLPEREEIAVALIEDASRAWAEIARRVGRHLTTVMCEGKASGAGESTAGGGGSRRRAAAVPTLPASYRMAQ